VTSSQTGGPANQTDNDQALIIKIRLSDEDMGTEEDEDEMFRLDEELRQAITAAQAGEYDGHEFGGGMFLVYIYGPSAERLFEVAWPVLARREFRLGSHVIKRYGKPGANKDIVPLEKKMEN
jgi:hypothetical protein